MPVPSDETFTSSGTWTKPAGAGVTWTHAYIRVTGGGAGGGAGQNRTSGSSRGGGGGGPGGHNESTVLHSDLASTETVVVGQGGPGGTAITVPNDNDPAHVGQDGETSSFTLTPGSEILEAFGGHGGGQGPDLGPGGTGGDDYPGGPFDFGYGGDGGGSTFSAEDGYNGGGGGGGGVNSGGTELPGGAGADSLLWSGAGGDGSSGEVGSSSGAGGDGAYPGGGGGGSGGIRGGSQSGKGGDGGDGEVFVSYSFDPDYADVTGGWTVGAVGWSA